MANKKRQIEQLQSLIAIKFLCLIALYFSFLLGPLLALFRIYFFVQRPKVEWETPPDTVNLLAVVGFAVLIWAKRLLDKKIEETKSQLPK
ncbi:MAG: hypothetical protein HND47_20045 [Chloroflexi bacterium]|nr:hypothetical protein [Chloroflexota bacterium]